MGESFHETRARETGRGACGLLSGYGFRIGFRHVVTRPFLGRPFTGIPLIIKRGLTSRLHAFYQRCHFERSWVEASPDRFPYAMRHTAGAYAQRRMHTSVATADAFPSSAYAVKTTIGLPTNELVNDSKDFQACRDRYR